MDDIECIFEVRSWNIGKYYKSGIINLLFDNIVIYVDLGVYFWKKKMNGCVWFVFYKDVDSLFIVWKFV